MTAEPSSGTTPEVVIATRKVAIAPPVTFQSDATIWFGRAEATARELVATAVAELGPVALAVRNARLQLSGASGPVGNAQAQCERISGVIARVRDTGETEFELRVTVYNLGKQVICRVGFRFHIAARARERV